MNDTTAQVPPATSSSSAEESAPVVFPKRDPKRLTAKQQLALELFQSGKSYKEAAGVMGISMPVYSKTLVAARKKLGIIAPKPKGRNALEHTNPAKFAAAVDAASHTNLEKLADAMREAGVPPGAAEGIIKRIRAKYYGVVSATRNLKTQEILDLLGNRIHLALQYMDDKAMAEASFRDLALGTTAMIEKRQLLRGEPTQIISDAERAKLHELLPMAIAEAKRRGLTVEGEVTGKSIEPA